jgi:hypothetical protein
MVKKKDKWRKEIKAADRRRARRFGAAGRAPVVLKANHSLERRMVREHLDVLQNIESTLVGAARDAEEVDDRVVEQVLQLAIRGASSENPIVQWVLDLLASMRETRGDVSDDVWRDGLRVVYTSLKRHSYCRSGEYEYLAFASQYAA